MASWVTYMLRCSDGTLYTGVTNDMKKRVRDHNAGRGAKYTRGRLPVFPVYMECHPNRSAAQKAEASLKKLTREQKLRKAKS